MVARADLVIVATAAPASVVTSEMLERERSSSDGPLWLVDISVPRNVDPEVRRIPGVDLLDLDSLQTEDAGADGAAAHDARAEAIFAAEEIVDLGVEDFMKWLDLHTAGRRLVPFREILTDVCRRELAFLAGDSDSARRTANRIVARVMAHPMSALRAAPKPTDSVEEVARAIEKLFSAVESEPASRFDRRPPSGDTAWSEERWGFAERPLSSTG